jgi:GNAT superfamily N-acetyltransferase
VSLPHLELTQGEYSISTDPWRLDIDAIHAYLTRSYWAKGISKELVSKALQNSLCLGLYAGAAQIGFARVITDKATFAYLSDVYVLEEHRGRGLGKWLMSVIVAHPDLQGLRRFSLATRDAQGLYRQFGFVPLAHPERHMEILQRGLYLTQKENGS